MAEYRVIGTPVERVDGVAMLSGQAVYGPDVKLRGMLWGKILRSPIAHGKILRVDVEKANNLPGVKAAISAADIPQRRYNFPIHDETIFAIDKVRYIGDAVAAVAAVDEEIAEEALGLIDVDYEELPAVFDAEEAMRQGAPLVHENMANYSAPTGYVST
jgi:CO/xanthine dehydrogenase Mo-binding subunit